MGVRGSSPLGPTRTKIAAIAVVFVLCDTPSDMKAPTVLAETKEYLVLDKPAGLAVHSRPGQTEPTLVDWLLTHYTEVKGVGEDPVRPGIVHRLDKGTSGVILVARTQAAYDFFKQQFIKRSVEKEYLALVWQVPKEQSGIIDAPLTRSKKGGFRWRVARGLDKNQRPAMTRWQVEKNLVRPASGEASWTLLRLFPKTGRTHQLRVHCASIGHPIAGDPVYAFKNQPTPPGLKRIFLHAAALTVELSDGKKRKFEAKLPQELDGALDSLGQNYK